MNINTKYIQFSGKAEVSQELKVGSNYEIISQGTIVSSTIHDNDNGTVDVSYKWRVIMSEITDEKGESIKAKDTRGNSTLIRNQAYAIWREYSTSKDFETFYNELTREYMKQADVIAKRLLK